MLSASSMVPTTMHVERVEHAEHAFDFAALRPREVARLDARGELDRWFAASLRQLAHRAGARRCRC